MSPSFGSSSRLSPRSREATRPPSSLSTAKLSRTLLEPTVDLPVRLLLPDRDDRLPSSCDLRSEMLPSRPLPRRFLCSTSRGRSVTLGSTRTSSRASTWTSLPRLLLRVLRELDFVCKLALTVFLFVLQTDLLTILHRLFSTSLTGLSASRARTLSSPVSVRDPSVARFSRVSSLVVPPSLSPPRDTTARRSNSTFASWLHRVLGQSTSVLRSFGFGACHFISFSYQTIYQECGSRGSALTVVPFNQGSKQDVDNLVDYIYSTLGLDLDYILPFAAIPENGREIDGLDDRSELAHRVMLVRLFPGLVTELVLVFLEYSLARTLVYASVTTDQPSPTPWCRQAKEGCST